MTDQERDTLLLSIDYKLSKLEAIESHLLDLLLPQRKAHLKNPLAIQNYPAIIPPVTTSNPGYTFKPMEPYVNKTGLAVPAKMYEEPKIIPKEKQFLDQDEKVVELVSKAVASGKAPSQKKTKAKK